MTQATVVARVLISMFGIGVRSYFSCFLRTLFRLVIADTVRFNFRAIKTLSVFEASSAKSCASSAGVHRRPWGSGPFLIAFAFSRVIDYLSALT
jgi:hypothetical protein